MSAPSAYIFFNGNCAEAMHHYEQVLNGKLETLLTQSDIPGAPRGDKRIMHARLAVNGGFIMASDWMAERPFEKKQGFYVSLSYDSAADARRVYEALAEGGKINMPMEKTFFAEAFGMLVDRYGTPWMVMGHPSN